MSRVKTGTIRRKAHKKILRQARGFVAARRKRYKAAKEAVLHSGQYAFSGRKAKKRNFRTLWIQRINAIAHKNGLNYNKFIFGLKKANIMIDKKILADLAVTDPESFQKIFEKAQEALGKKIAK